LVVIYGSFIDYIDFLQAVPGVFNWKNDHILIAKSGNATIKKLRDWGVFLNSRSMDNLFFKRVNSWQGLVKKEQESVFEKSISLPYNL